MENINLIRKIAWSFHNSTGEEWDDLFQEAALAYLEALKTYNPKKGKITTYMWWCITSHLKNYLKLKEKQTGHLQPEENLPDTKPAVPTNLENLTEDAQQIADMIVQNFVKYSTINPQQAGKEIAKQMFREKQWSWSKVRSGIQDLRLAFS